METISSKSWKIIIENNNNVFEIVTCQQRGGSVEGRPEGASWSTKWRRRRTGSAGTAREAQFYQMRMSIEAIYSRYEQVNDITDLDLNGIYNST